MVLQSCGKLYKYFPESGFLAGLCACSIGRATLNRTHAFTALQVLCALSHLASLARALLTSRRRCRSAPGGHNHWYNRTRNVRALAIGKAPLPCFRAWRLGEARSAPRRAGLGKPCSGHKRATVSGSAGARHGPSASAGRAGTRWRPEDGPGQAPARARARSAVLRYRTDGGEGGMAGGSWRWGEGVGPGGLADDIDPSSPRHRAGQCPAAQRICTRGA
jgi:hypothetical protein